MAIHDVHHVIGGELQVLGFTLGLFPDHALLMALAGSVAPKLRDQLDAPAFAPVLPRIWPIPRPIPRPIAALDAHRARQHHPRRRQGR